jgi:hypothetical protein
VNKVTSGCIAINSTRLVQGPTFSRTEACPREIRITSVIGEVKKAILKGSARAEPIRHPATSAA